MGKNKTTAPESILDDFNARVDQVLADTTNQKLLKSALWQKLEPLKEGITRLRKQNIPYKNIVAIIAEVTAAHGQELKVSEQTLREYCQKALGLPKVYRRKNDDTKSASLAK